MEKIWIPFQMIIDLSSFRNHHLEFIIHNSELYRSVAATPLMPSALRGGGDTSADGCGKQVKSPFARVMVLENLGKMSKNVQKHLGKMSIIKGDCNKRRQTFAHSKQTAYLCC